MDMQDDVDDYGTVRPERTYQLIQFALRDGVARLTLNRPPANVLSVEMMEEINAALESLEYYEPLAVAFDKKVDSTSLTAAVSTIVDEMHADGTLTALSKKWYDGVDYTTAQ